LSGERRLNKYGSYAELARCELQGSDYRITACARPQSPVLIVAPHGGLIEIGTSEIAAAVAGDDYNLFSFEGLKPYGANRDLHITPNVSPWRPAAKSCSACTAVSGIRRSMSEDWMRNSPRISRKVFPAPDSR
jgi:hypothetical protein